ncbi:unnamed protein product [Orchesella dallaii]|uniref:Glucuronosyltransferase n=1 Tax=Orchesella dallaii TaxID=48710 RepID=A0ABP1QTP4_9HEXA
MDFHRIPAWPLATGLAERGHNVTFISPYTAKTPHPKVRDLVPQKLKEWVDTWEEVEDVFAQRKGGNWINRWFGFIDDGINLCEVIYSDNEFVNWVKTVDIDLIFIDSLFNECGYGLAHKFGAKVIHFSSSVLCAWNAESFGKPDETNWIPDFAFPFDPTTVTFKQRLTNALIPVVGDIYRRWKYFPKLEEITREKLGITDFPNFEEIERNTSLVFVNGHYGGDFARPLPPNMVSIAGIAQTEKGTPLPNKLEAFLEKGNGFIYVSFGTYADFQRMDASTLKAIIGAMQSFSDMQFVLKMGNHSLVNKAFPNGNAFISNWLPQHELLAHPKIKAFITHAGLNSVQESIYNAVPLISFPIFADQDFIAERIHRKEYGVRLEITTVVQAEVEDAITKVLTDPKYRENMKKMSRIFKDRPHKPLDTALWWTNYVLTHSREDLEALRPLSIRQSCHRIPAWPLATGLAERGHNVTFISPFPAKSPHPKVHDLVPQKLIEWSDSWKDHDHLFVQRKANDLIYQWIQLIHDGVDMCELVYSDKEFLNWMETAELDLIFIDSLFNECGYGLAHKFGAKIIHFTASTACSWNAESFGNPDTTNWISDFAFPFDPTTVTFKERLINALIPVAWDLYRRWVYFPKLEEITRENLGIKDFPKFEEIERNTSLVFLNTHYGEEFARPLPPNMVSIGGIAYVEKRTTLPKVKSKGKHDVESKLCILLRLHD